MTLSLKYNREICLTVGKSRQDTCWKIKRVLLSEFYAKLSQPVVSSETLSEYLRLPRESQGQLKDVGGYVAGELSGGRRTSKSVRTREIITLDLDEVPEGFRIPDDLNFGYALHSTRKHSPESPRLRVLVPLNEFISANMYEPVARLVAQKFGPEFYQALDKSTFEPSRLMYWPSVCRGSQFIFRVHDEKLISSGELLLQVYKARELQELREQEKRSRSELASSSKLNRFTKPEKSGKPEKPGIIKLFCDKYDIHDAIEKFLPDVYEPSDYNSGFSMINAPNSENTKPERYKLIGSHSTAGGVVSYDQRKLYSFHATDPACQDRWLNAFELVRIHKFGHLDQDRPDESLSFRAMIRFAEWDLSNNK